MGRLDGKVALFSGTARGMGRAAAVEFAAQGAAVFGCDLDEAASAETVDLVTAGGGLMAALAPVNLSSAEGAQAWAGAAARKFGARFTGQVPHGSAKGGVLAMTKHLCAAGGQHRIRANAILPGLIYTPETARFMELWLRRRLPGSTKGWRSCLVRARDRRHRT
jgi:NAD(P)-dependent dehydrogenase (short-subunit alcohol dehydrogenase family)